MLTIASRSLSSGPGGVGRRRRTKEQTHFHGSALLLDPGGYLLSRAVASQVPSAYEGLTSVFGMGTGGTLQPNHRKSAGVLLNTLKTA